MLLTGVKDVVRVEVDLTPDEARSLYTEINKISGQTPLTQNELNEQFPVTAQLLAQLHEVITADTKLTP